MGVAVAFVPPWLMVTTDAVLSNVPLVGNVTDVDPVKVAVKGDAPEKVKFPPMVMMLEPLFTPVPP